MLDAVLPGLSGLDACGRIKGELHPNNAPPVVLTSGVSRSANQREWAIERYGADACLAKPFSQQELVETRNAALPS